MADHVAGEVASGTELTPSRIASHAVGRIIRHMTTTLVLVFLALCLSGCIYNGIAARRLARETSTTPRDPATGIALKAMPVELGKGSPRGVLLVHGFVGSPRDFGRLPNALQEAGFRVSAPLLPGHGTRPSDVVDVTISEMSRAVAEAYDRLRQECETVAVVGFSMGGSLVLRLIRDDALPAPDALVLVCPYLRVRYRWYAVLPPETWHAIASLFVPYVIRGDTFTQVNRREAVSDIQAYDVISTRFIATLMELGNDVRTQPPKAVQTRTLLAYSPGDAAACPRAMVKMAERMRIPEANRAPFRKSNHHLFHDFEREQVIERIVSFLLGR